MVKWNFNLVAKMVLRAVEKCDEGIKLTLRNIIPSITIKDFKIDKIGELADVFINDQLIEQDFYQNIKVILDNKLYNFPDFEELPEIVIPHRPDTQVILPIDAQKGEKIRLKGIIKTKPLIEIKIERKIK